MVLAIKAVCTDQSHVECRDMQRRQSYFRITDRYSRCNSVTVYGKGLLGVRNVDSEILVIQITLDLQVRVKPVIKKFVQHYGIINRSISWGEYRSDLTAVESYKEFIVLILLLSND